MSAALRIVRPGVLSTLQDGGRTGYRALGVPRSGALDAVALRLVNALLANSPGCAAIELLYGGPIVEASGGSVRIALACTCGLIEDGAGTARALPAWQTAVLRAGERLRIAAPATTAAAYLGVEGGYAVEPLLGSASTYLAGGLGGWHGRALRTGDMLPLVQAAATASREQRYRIAPDLRAPAVLEAMPGPQHEAFAPEAFEQLASAEYRMLPASNRTGLRLEGPRLAHRGGYDLLSEGVATGSLQVPGSGQPILLIGDHPTVGGYPKIATVISAACAAAGRLRIGGTVRFRLVDADEAAAARAAHRAWLRRIEESVEAV
jgi:biotin-dependent carboxylase-like uncharacterized protein